MKANKKTRVECTRTTSITIERSDIIEFLASKGHKVPNDAMIYVEVPGGGDWSHTDLHIGTETDIYVRFTETTNEEED